jgi:hypothetical protein
MTYKVIFSLVTTSKRLELETPIMHVQLTKRIALFCFIVYDEPEGTDMNDGHERKKTSANDMHQMRSNGEKDDEKGMLIIIKSS